MDKTDRKIMRILRNSEDALSSQEIIYLLELLGNKEDQNELNEIIKVLRNKKEYKKIEKRFEKAKEEFKQLNKKLLSPLKTKQGELLKRWSFEINKSNLIRHLKYLKKIGLIIDITRGNHNYWEIERFTDLDQIKSGLKDDNPNERVVAIKKLIIRNRRDDVSLIWEYFQKDKDPIVKHWLLQALGIIGGPKAIKKLISAMGEEDEFVRLGVTEGLKMQGKGIRSKIMEQLKSSENETVRLSALEVLAYIGKDDSEMVQIIKKLKNDPNERICKFAERYGKRYEKSINKK